MMPSTSEGAEPLLPKPVCDVGHVGGGLDQDGHSTSLSLPVRGKEAVGADKAGYNPRSVSVGPPLGQSKGDHIVSQWCTFNKVC